MLWVVLKVADHDQRRLGIKTRLFEPSLRHVTISDVDLSFLSQVSPLHLHSSAKKSQVTEPGIQSPRLLRSADIYELETRW